MRLILVLLLSISAWSQMQVVRRPLDNPTGGGGQTPIYRNNIVSVSSGGASANSLTTGTIAITAADLVVCGVSHGDNTTPASSVSCGGESLTRLGSVTDSTSNFVLDLWYRANASANASATCTANYAAIVAWRSVKCASYGNILTASPADQFSCNSVSCTGTTSSAITRTAQNVTTTQANELLVWINVDFWTHNWTSQNSFNLRMATTSTDEMFADKVLVTAGTAPNGNVATVDDQSDDQYLAVFATFKPAP